MEATMATTMATKFKKQCTDCGAVKINGTWHSKPEKPIFGNILHSLCPGCYKRQQEEKTEERQRAFA